MGQGMEERVGVIEVQLTNVSKDMHEMNKTINKIAEYLRELSVVQANQEQHRQDLIQLEQKMEGHETRIRAIEIQYPVLRLASGWVFKGLIGVVSLLGIIAAGVIVDKMIDKAPRAQEKTVQVLESGNAPHHKARRYQ